MRKGIIYSLIAGLIALMSACVATVHSYNMADEYGTSLHYGGMEGGAKSDEDEGGSDLVGLPARTFYGGDLKRGAIWWAGKGIVLEKGEVFTITATNIGPDSIPFGATFPPLDFTKEKVMIKISARAESLDSVNKSEPSVYLQLGDADGNQANAKLPFNKIANSTEFQDYYFDAQDFIQVLPKKRKVNGAMINGIKVFINPGQSAYNGKIFIKEIKVVPAVKP